MLDERANKTAGCTVVYSAVLRPHRSAGTGTACTVVAMIATACVVFAIGFVAAGAWPVLPFLGAEVVLVYGTFRLCERAGKAYEAINLTRSTLTVRRVDHWGNRSDFSFPVQWLRVSIEHRPTRPDNLQLCSHGVSLTIGAFLPPEERSCLASALGCELSRLSRVSDPA